MPGTFRRKWREPKPKPPNKKHDKRKANDDVGVVGAKFVGELLCRSFLLLRFLDETNNLLQRTFRRWSQHQRLNRSPKIHCPGQRMITDPFRDRRRFTRQI